MADAEMEQPGTIQEQVKNAIAASQNGLMDEMRLLISSEMQKMSEKQKEIADSQISKIEHSINDTYKFKRRGNEEQYKHNQKVLNKFTEAESLIQSEFEPQNFEKAKKTIAEGIDLVKHRQKLVKLADSSDLGWKVVQEYEANPLADDSEDEKKIFKAQSRAERKNKAEWTKRYSRPQPYPPQGQRKQYGQSDQQGERPFRPGVCFNCGKKGHWKKDCTAEKTGTNEISKTYCFGKKVNNQADKCSAEQEGKHVDSLNQSSVISPVGRLRSCLPAWKEINSNEYVLRIIEKGYKLPLKTIPGKVLLQNNKSARDNPKFVSQEIEKLRIKGCISQVNHQPEVVNPLTVAYNKTNKPRLVLDCRHVNPHLFQFKFKYEDGSVARKMFNQGEFVFNFDLKSAYHHVMIHPDDRSYLGFSWNGIYYQFNVLPFGLATAGFIFSKITREVVRSWRGQGIKVIMYLDDGLGGAESYDDACMVSTRIRNDLIELGFLIAEEKCKWGPCQSLVWLGLVWDLKEGKLRLTQERVDKILESVENLFHVLKGNALRLVKVKHLASIVGRLISAQAVMGEQVRLRTRHAYYCILGRASWQAPVVVSKEAENEMVFWHENLNVMNRTGSDICQVTSDEACDAKMFCDASGQGYGGFVTLGFDEFPDEEQMHGVWNLQEQNESSTWRELESVNRVLHESLSHIENKCTEVYTDNKNVETILKLVVESLCYKTLV